MSNFKIYIDLDNDAFSGDDCGPEVARILYGVAKHFKTVDRSDLEGHGLNLKDCNGNTCGFAEFDIEDEDEDEDEEENDEEDES